MHNDDDGDGDSDDDNDDGTSNSSKHSSNNGACMTEIVTYQFSFSVVWWCLNKYWRVKLCITTA